MIDFINKFKIPTIVGLGIIFLGLASGLYLVLREQIFFSQAAPNLTAQNITVSNLTDEGATVSWQTNSATSSFVTFGQNTPGEQTALDDKDIDLPKPHLIHYVTLKNLLPQTHYQFKILTGKITSYTGEFDTAKPLTTKSTLTPIIGSVLNGNTPLNEGVVYLTINGANGQAALIKTGGNFLIPLSYLRKSDLTDVFPQTEDIIAKITVLSSKEPASLLFKLKANLAPLPPIKLGQNIDLTVPEETPQPSPNVKDLDKYDLNSDGKVNSTDYAIILQNFGKNPKNKKADINGNGIVDQKDLDLMSQKLKEPGSQ